MPMKCLHWMGIVVVFWAPLLWSADPLFEIKPVVDGVYAAIAKAQYKMNCNAAIVLLEDGVLVVDTHSKPSAARALIAQIKTVADNPVKYVINTHFHWEHYQW
jgi:glyoxylase-like metal-dependent hydrolase (beta-lactamase superfamily II)